MNEQFVRREDTPLLIDVYCYSCGRLVALSNTDEVDGRRYCHRCVEGDCLKLRREA